MVSQGSVTSTTGYVNYIYNISSRGTAQVASQLLGLSGIAGNILGQIAFQTSSYLTSTEGALLSLGVVASAGLSKATEFAAEFNQEMETVHAISGKTVTTLADDAMEMSNKFGVALGDMTKGLEALARAGVSTGNMTTILEQAMGLSKLEGLPLEKSINDLISTTNLLDTSNLDLESPEYAEAVKYQTQKITATSEAAPINAQDIIHTLEHIGGYASSTNLDQDDLYAVIAQLGSKGTKSEMAGTSLRAFIAAGQKDTAQRALKRIGLDVSDLWKNDDTIMSISDMKDVLDEAMEARGYTQQEKLEFYSDFAGYKQANQIMKIDTTSVREFKDKIDRSWSTSKKMETVLNTAQTNLQSLMQTGINFLTKVGEPLLLIVSPVAKLIKTMIDVVDAVPFSNWAVALGLSVVSLKAVSTIFNKVGPQLLSHVNSVLNIRNLWDDTKESIKESYGILSNARNFDYLRQKERDNDISRITDEDKAQFWRAQGYDIRSYDSIRRLEHQLGGDHYKEIKEWKAERLNKPVPLIKKLERLDNEGKGNREENRKKRRSQGSGSNAGFYNKFKSFADKTFPDAIERIVTAIESTKKPSSDRRRRTSRVRSYNDYVNAVNNGTLPGRRSTNKDIMEEMLNIKNMLSSGIQQDINIDSLDKISSNVERIVQILEDTLYKHQVERERRNRFDRIDREQRNRDTVVKEETDQMLRAASYISDREKRKQEKIERDKVLNAPFFEIPLNEMKKIFTKQGISETKARQIKLKFNFDQSTAEGAALAEEIQQRFTDVLLNYGKSRSPILSGLSPEALVADINKRIGSELTRRFVEVIGPSMIQSRKPGFGFFAGGKWVDMSKDAIPTVSNGWTREHAERSRATKDTFAANFSARFTEDEVNALFKYLRKELKIPIEKFSDQITLGPRGGVHFASDGIDDLNDIMNEVLKGVAKTYDTSYVQNIKNFVAKTKYGFGTSELEHRIMKEPFVEKNSEESLSALLILNDINKSAAKRKLSDKDINKKKAAELLGYRFTAVDAKPYHDSNGEVIGMGGSTMVNTLYNSIFARAYLEGALTRKQKKEFEKKFKIRQDKNLSDWEKIAYFIRENTATQYEEADNYIAKMLDITDFQAKVQYNPQDNRKVLGKGDKGIRYNAHNSLYRDVVPSVQQAFLWGTDGSSGFMGNLSSIIASAIEYGMKEYVDENFGGNTNKVPFLRRPFWKSPAKRYFTLNNASDPNRDYLDLEQTIWQGLQAQSVARHRNWDYYTGTIDTAEDDYLWEQLAYISPEMRKNNDGVYYKAERDQILSLSNEQLLSRVYKTPGERGASKRTGTAELSPILTVVDDNGKKVVTSGMFMRRATHGRQFFNNFNMLDTFQEDNVLNYEQVKAIKDALYAEMDQNGQMLMDFDQDNIAQATERAKKINEARDFVSATLLQPENIGIATNEGFDYLDLFQSNNISALTTALKIMQNNENRFDKKDVKKFARLMDSIYSIDAEINDIAMQMFEREEDAVDYVSDLYNAGDAYSIDFSHYDDRINSLRNELNSISRRDNQGYRVPKSLNDQPRFSALQREISRLELNKKYVLQDTGLQHEKDIEKAREKVEKAKEGLKEAESAGNPKDILKAKEKLEKAKTSLGDALTAQANDAFDRKRFLQSKNVSWDSIREKLFPTSDEVFHDVATFFIRGDKGTFEDVWSQSLQMMRNKKDIGGSLQQARTALALRYGISDYDIHAPELTDSQKQRVEELYNKQEFVSKQQYIDTYGQEAFDQLRKEMLIQFARQDRRTGKWNFSTPFIRDAGEITPEEFDADTMELLDDGRILDFTLLHRTRAEIAEQVQLQDVMKEIIRSERAHDATTVGFSNVPFISSENDEFGVGRWFGTDLEIPISQFKNGIVEVYQEMLEADNPQEFLNGIIQYDETLAKDLMDYMNIRQIYLTRIKQNMDADKIELDARMRAAMVTEQQFIADITDSGEIVNKMSDALEDDLEAIPTFEESYQGTQRSNIRGEDERAILKQVTDLLNSNREAALNLIEGDSADDWIESFDDDSLFVIGDRDTYTDFGGSSLAAAALRTALFDKTVTNPQKEKRLRKVLSQEYDKVQGARLLAELTYNLMQQEKLTMSEARKRAKEIIKNDDIQNPALQREFTRDGSIQKHKENYIDKALLAMQSGEIRINTHSGFRESDLGLLKDHAKYVREELLKRAQGEDDDIELLSDKLTHMSLSQLLLIESVLDNTDTKLIAREFKFNDFKEKYHTEVNPKESLLKREQQKNANIVNERKRLFSDFKTAYDSLATKPIFTGSDFVFEDFEDKKFGLEEYEELQVLNNISRGVNVDELTTHKKQLNRNRQIAANNLNNQEWWNEMVGLGQYFVEEHKQQVKNAYPTNDEVFQTLINVGQYNKEQQDMQRNFARMFNKPQEVNESWTESVAKGQKLIDAREAVRELDEENKQFMNDLMGLAQSISPDNATKEFHEERKRRERENKLGREGAKRVDQIMSYYDQLNQFVSDRMDALVNATVTRNKNDEIVRIGSNDKVIKATNMFGESLKSASETLTSWRDILGEVSEVFPPLTVAVIALETVLTGLEKIGKLNTGITDFMTIAQQLSQGKIQQLFGHDIQPNGNIAKMIISGSAILSDALVIFKDFIVSFGGPILALVAAITVFTKALEWSRDSHAKWLKQLEEEQKERRSKSIALQATTKDARQGLKNARNDKQGDFAYRNYELARTRLNNANMERARNAMDLSDARNDSLWGDYGIASGIGKLQGNYESTATEYEGSSEQIRKIKEANLFNIFSSGSMKHASAYYDANRLAISQIDEYKDELGKLYDVETKMIRRNQPGMNPRDTPQFQKALDEFVEATGVTKEHAYQYLDYMQTERHVDTATHAMHAEAAQIKSDTEMKIRAISLGGNPSDILGLNGIENQQKAMIKAQADMTKMELSGQLWWKAVWSTITAPVKLIVSPIFAIAHILGAIWSFVTGNWGSAWDHAAKVGTSFNAFSEASTYWGAWAQTEATDFNSIGQNSVDEQDRMNYGNAAAALGGSHYVNGPQPSYDRQSLIQHNERSKATKTLFGAVTGMLGTIITILNVMVGALLLNKAYQHRDAIKSVLGQIKNLLTRIPGMNKATDFIDKYSDKIPGMKWIKSLGIFDWIRKQFGSEPVKQSKEQSTGIRRVKKDKETTLDDFGKPDGQTSLDGWNTGITLDKPGTGITRDVTGGITLDKSGTGITRDSDDLKARRFDPDLTYYGYQQAKNNLNSKSDPWLFVLDDMLDDDDLNYNQLMNASLMQFLQRGNIVDGLVTGEVDKNEMGAAFSPHDWIGLNYNVPAEYDNGILELLATYLHETSHVVLRHNERSALGMLPNEKEMYYNERPSELEANLLTQRLLAHFGLSSEVVDRDVGVQSREALLTGSAMYVDDDLLAAAENVMMQNMPQIIGMLLGQQRELQAYGINAGMRELINDEIMPIKDVVISNPSDDALRIQQRYSDVKRRQFTLYDFNAPLEEVLPEDQTTLDQWMLTPAQQFIADTKQYLEDTYDNMMTSWHDSVVDQVMNVAKAYLPGRYEFGRKKRASMNKDQREFLLQNYFDKEEADKIRNANMYSTDKNRMIRKSLDERGLWSKAMNDLYYHEQDPTGELGITGIWRNYAQEQFVTPWKNYMQDQIARSDYGALSDREQAKFSKRKEKTMTAEELDLLEQKYGIKVDDRSNRKNEVIGKLKDTGQWDDAMATLHYNDRFGDQTLTDVVKTKVDQKFIQPWREYAEQQATIMQEQAKQKIIDIHNATKEEAQAYRAGDISEEDVSWQGKMYAKGLDLQEKYLGVGGEDGSIFDILQDPDKTIKWIKNAKDDTLVGQVRNKGMDFIKTLQDPEEFNKKFGGAISSMGDLLTNPEFAEATLAEKMQMMKGKLAGFFNPEDKANFTNDEIFGGLWGAARQAAEDIRQGQNEEENQGIFGGLWGAARQAAEQEQAAQQPREPKDVIMCPYCGYLNDSKNLWCDNCGRVIASEDKHTVMPDYEKNMAENQGIMHGLGQAAKANKRQQRRDKFDAGTLYKEEGKGHAVIKCPACGALNDIEAEECYRCGADLSGVLGELMDNKDFYYNDTRKKDDPYKTPNKVARALTTKLGDNELTIQEIDDPNSHELMNTDTIGGVKVNAKNLANQAKRFGSSIGSEYAVSGLHEIAHNLLNPRNSGEAHGWQDKRRQGAAKEKDRRLDWLDSPGELEAVMASVYAAQMMGIEVTPHEIERMKEMQERIGLENIDTQKVNAAVQVLVGNKDAFLGKFNQSAAMMQGFSDEEKQDIHDTLNGVIDDPKQKVNYNDSTEQKLRMHDWAMEHARKLGLFNEGSDGSFASAPMTTGGIVPTDMGDTLHNVMQNEDIANVLTGESSVSDVLLGEGEGMTGLFGKKGGLAKGGKGLSKVGNLLSGKGGRVGKLGGMLSKGGQGLSRLGGKGAGGALKSIGGKLGKTGIGKAGGKLLGKVGGKIAGKIGGKLAAKAGAQVASKVLGGALMATGIGAPLGLLLESPLGGMIMEGVFDLGGKALGAVGGGVKKALGLGHYSNGPGGGGMLGALMGVTPLGMLGKAFGGASGIGRAAKGVLGGVGGAVAGGLGAMFGGMFGLGGGAKGAAGFMKATGPFSMISVLKGTKDIAEKHLSVGEKQKKAMDKIVENTSNHNNSNASGGSITIQNININTDDDPEAIKAMFLDLIVELQEQVNPRLVSRTTGSSNTSTNDSSEQSGTEQSQTQSNGGSSTSGGQGLGGH